MNLEALTMKFEERRLLKKASPVITSKNIKLTTIIKARPIITILTMISLLKAYHQPK
tara:strand:+ start:352 stop:522 length:171 start_codon:yes stop_codon:yes gene_type:complete